MLTSVIPPRSSRHQVVGRHLVLAPRPGRDLRFGLGRIAGVVASRRAPTGRCRAVRRAAAASDRQRDELVDVAVVVGEQDELLEVLGRRPGVVLEPGEGEVGAQAVEQGQRPRLAEPGSQSPSAISSPMWTSSVVGNERASSER